ncbi:MAG: GspH/FimT family pseudopilin [Sulfuricella sp.]|nr:GspH/FimT family pseudopilin [Sulfuricella sp.]
MLTLSARPAWGLLRNAVRQTGATLVEILVGLALVAVLVGSALPGFMTWIQNTQIRTAAESMLNAMQFARAEAVRRNEQVRVSLLGFDWTISDAAGNTIETRVSGEGSRNAVLTVVGAMPLTFNGLGRPIAGTPAIGGGSDVTQITVSNPVGGGCQGSGGPMRCLEIHVTLSGQVRMCDPQMTVLDPTNPQAC